MKVSTILNATDTLQADLEYLCSLVEDISKNDLSDDESYVKLSEKEIVMLNDYNTETEEAIQRLELVCGISLQNN